MKNISLRIFQKVTRPFQIDNFLSFHMLFYRLIAVVFFTLLNPIYDITQNIDSFLLILVLQIIWVLSHNLQVNNRQVNLPVPSIIIVFNRCYCIYNTNGIDPV